MQINKKLVTLAAIATVAGSSVLGGAAIAATNNDDGNYPPIVDKIAAKFNLDKEEVKKVFDEERSEHQAEHQQKLEERLTQAVNDGKLTEDQKTKLLAKMEELAAERQTEKESRQDRRQEFEDWAEENGIKLSEVLPKIVGGPRRGGHGPF